MLENIKKKNVFVVTGPSGVGKGTILNNVLNKYQDIVYSVSATTRKPRDGEIDSVQYYFKTVEEFKALIKNDDMLEWAIFADNYYGTIKSVVQNHLIKGNDVILEIEVQGALQVKAKFPEAKLIFIAPPSIDDLRQRLKNRNTESDEVIEKRVSAAVRELEKINEFDYKIINDDLNTAIKSFEEIILSLRE